MIKQIIRCGLDYAGGIIGSTSQQNFCFVDFAPIACIGESVGPHYHGNSIITSSMKTGSLVVFVNMKGVCRNGDVANCGHQATGGSNIVFSI